MKVKVTPPGGKDWNANEAFMKPVYSALGDLLVASKGPKYQIVCGIAWFNELEGKSQEFSGRQYTVKERLLTCSFFTSVMYSRRMGEWEVELKLEEK